MMSILEYAEDTNRSVEEILGLVKKLEIKKTQESDMLTDEEITLLDNELSSLDVNEEVVVEDLEEKYELEDKAEELASAFVKEEKAKTSLKAKKVGTTNTKQEFLKNKKNLYKKREKLQTNDETDNNVVIYKEMMSVSELAENTHVAANELIKKLFNLGIMATVNTSLAFDVAEMLVVDYNKELKKEESTDIANFEEYEIIDKEDDLTKRPPVITIMGHVDHGKTTLLDYIRNSEIANQEAGGITQAIGAYQVNHGGRKLTFVDTPGHEAFTNMRARGASVTDIVIIVVAADDGIKVQTKEAIDHAKAANVPIIVAINKIDKPNTNIDRVYSELSENGLSPEEWGGDTVVVKVSALTGEGVDKLLDAITLISEMADLKTNEKRYASGTVLEAKLDKKVGSIVSIIVQNGTLRLGDPVVVGTSYGKIRTLKNDRGQNLSQALPSTPVEITGLSELPSAGDKFMAFETEKQARSISAERQIRAKEQATNKTGITLEELFGNVHDEKKEINIVLKADVKGSEEAVKQSLLKLKVEDIKINIIRTGVGEVTESDVILATASKAIVIAFSVNVSNSVLDIAKDKGVEIRKYDIIYKLVEDMENAMKGILEPIFEEKVTGKAEIRQIFTFSKVGNIAGSHVIDGTIKNNQNIHVMRKDEIIYTGKIRSIQREKDQTKEVSKGMDCGITLDGFQDIKELDVIVAFNLVEVKR